MPTRRVSYIVAGCIRGYERKITRTSGSGVHLHLAAIAAFSSAQLQHLPWYIALEAVYGL